MSDYLIACGGTGGHLAPGIALAEALRARGHDAVLIVSRKQVDAKLCSQYPELRFEPLPGRPFSFGSPASWWDLFKACRHARRLIRERRPAAAVCFGGFTSAGVALASRLSGLPLYLHEANHVPGKAVRLFRRLARRVFVPDGVRWKHASDPRVSALGFPLRMGMKPMSRLAARRALGLPEEGRILLVLGGSQGAEPLNRWVEAAAPALASRGICIVCIAGMARVREPVVQSLAGPVAGGSVPIWWLPFTDRMPEFMCAADLAVARAGAGTISEMAALGLPSILVPYPQAADDHQTANAEAAARRGGATVLVQERMDEASDLVLGLLDDENALAAMRDVLGVANSAPGARERLADIIISETSPAANGPDASDRR